VVSVPISWPRINKARTLLFSHKRRFPFAYNSYVTGFTPLYFFSAIVAFWYPEFPHIAGAIRVSTLNTIRLWAFRSEWNSSNHSSLYSGKELNRKSVRWIAGDHRNIWATHYCSSGTDVRALYFFCRLNSRSFIFYRRSSHVRINTMNAKSKKNE